MRVSILAEGPGAGGRIERVLRRAMVASRRVDHAGVVPLRGVGRTRVGYLVAEDRIDGPTLAEVVAGSPLPAVGAARVALDLVDGLAAAHRAGLVHGALTPDDVRLVDGAATVGGFGVVGALLAAGVGGAGAPVADVRYLAPEQLDGAPPDEATDRWALGAVLYHTITGLPPFGSRGWSKDASLSWPSGAPAGLRAVCESLLSVDRRQRGSLDDVRAALAASAVPSPVRLPRWAAAALAVFLVMAVAGGVLVVRGDPGPGGRVAVPDLRGAPLQEATELLADARLSATVQAQRDADADVGTVIAQRPSAGGTAGVGEVVTLVVSVGDDQVEVPDLVGLPEVGAQVRAEAADLLLDVSGEGAGEGTVVEQRPAAGALAPRLSAIEVVLVEGPPPA